MARKYYTLIHRENGVWGVAFGDYSRACVNDEREEYLRDYPAKDLAIICTSDAQSDIDAVIAQRNEWRNAT